MRRYIILMIASIMLIGCSAQTEQVVSADTIVDPIHIHVDINDEVVGDSYEVMRTIEEAVKQNQKPDMTSLFGYNNKYINHYDRNNLTEEEEEIVVNTVLMVSRVYDYIKMDGEQREFGPDQSKWYKVLETGEYQYTNLDTEIDTEATTNIREMSTEELKELTENNFTKEEIGEYVSSIVSKYLLASTSGEDNPDETEQLTEALSDIESAEKEIKANYKEESSQKNDLLNLINQTRIATSDALDGNVETSDENFYEVLNMTGIISNDYLDGELPTIVQALGVQDVNEIMK